jgi:unsaturated rhamnogalacturonyl hydrolase
MTKFIFLLLVIFSLHSNANIKDDKKNLSDVVRNFIQIKSPEKLDWNWEEAIGLFGLARVADVVSKKQRFEILEFIKRYHYYYDKKKPEISWADECPSVLSALFLKREYFESKGINFWRVLDYLKNAELNEIGSIDHLGEDSTIGKFFPPYRNSIWLDSMMMWGNLSIRAGLLMGDAQLIDLALSQPKIFSTYLQDSDTGMFIHSYNYGGDYTFPRKKLFWTRGNGWVVATLADYLELMPKGDYRFNEIKIIFKNLVKGFYEANKKNDLWRNLYPVNKDNRVDTSGSALVAYGMAKGFRLGVLEEKYFEQAKKSFSAINKYLKKTKHGKRLTRVIGPTVPGPRLFYRIIPYQKNSYYGHGAYFLLASEMLKK